MLGDEYLQYPRIHGSSSAETGPAGLAVASRCGRLVSQSCARDKACAGLRSSARAACRPEPGWRPAGWDGIASSMWSSPAGASRGPARGS